MRKPFEALIIDAISYRRGPRPRRMGAVTVDAHVRRDPDTVLFIRGRGRKRHPDDIIVKAPLDLVVDNRHRSDAS